MTSAFGLEFLTPQSLRASFPEASSGQAPKQVRDRLPLRGAAYSNFLLTSHF